MLHVQHTLQARYPDFFANHRLAARTVSACCRLLFRESRFQDFSAAYPNLRGFELIRQALVHLDFRLQTTGAEHTRIPASGRVVVVANHPIGSLDGLALLDLIHRTRSDVKVVANDFLTAIDPLAPVLLPVTNMGTAGTSRRALIAIRKHLETEGALLIFPAGEVSRLGRDGIRDPHWQTGFLKLAGSAGSSIVPVHLATRNSLVFYGLSLLSKPLSTAWLVREMFKHRRKSVPIRIGHPIPHAAYANSDDSAQQLAERFRDHVYQLGAGSGPVFGTTAPVAAPENRDQLRQELAASERIGRSRGGRELYLVRMDEAPVVMREIGRLRELTFRAAGEGTGKARDIDRYDRDYEQLVLWDNGSLEIAGAYRLGDGRRIIERAGFDGLYSASLFKYGPGMRRKLCAGLELGRSFVQPRYQSRRCLDYLWNGIGAYIKRNPHIRYLFGPASISARYGAEATARIAHYFGTYYGHPELEVYPRMPFKISEATRDRLRTEFSGLDREADFAILKDQLAAVGLRVPTLYRQYAEVTAPDGAVFTAFNVDAEFSGCIDSFVIVDLARLCPRKRERYITCHGSS